MRVIEFKNPHRQKHFAFFQKMESPHFSMVAPISVGRLMDFIEANALHVSGTIVYLISRVANEIPEFRWRIRGNSIVEHDLVHPSFTVNTQETDVFSFCYVRYQEEYPEFVSALRQAQRTMHTDPSLEDEVDRDDYLFMSSVPWVHFTAFTHPMHIPSQDSVPRFAWGKIAKTGSESRMPLSVQAHHGVVDGRHVGLYYELMQEYCSNPENGVRITTK